MGLSANEVGLSVRKGRTLTVVGQLKQNAITSKHAYLPLRVEAVVEAGEHIACNNIRREVYHDNHERQGGTLMLCHEQLLGPHNTGRASGVSHYLGIIHLPPLTDSRPGHKSPATKATAELCALCLNSQRGASTDTSKRP